MAKKTQNVTLNENVTIYDTPVKLFKGDVIKEFPEGIILICSSTLSDFFPLLSPNKEKYFNIEATIKYGTENVEELLDKITSVISERRGKAIILQANPIPPFAKTNMLNEPMFFTFEEFISKDNEFIKTIGLLYDRVHNTKAEEAGLYVAYSTEKEIVVLFGHGIFSDGENMKSEAVTHYMPFSKWLSSSQGKSYIIKGFFSIKNLTETKDEEKWKQDQSTDEKIPEDVVEAMKLPKICEKIREWLSSGGAKDLLFYMNNRVKGQPEMDIFVANVCNYLQQVSIGNRHHNNMLLAAPSGTGKTETYRALSDYFSKQIEGLPISQYDMTTMTENGYKGDEADAALLSLFEHSETNGIGIIFYDEFDKKIAPSICDGGVNVNLAVQGQLLTMIEGREMRPSEKTQKRLKYPSVQIDTSNTLFLGLGSYDMFRKKKKDKSDHATVGFFQDKGKEYDHYDSITKEDMIELGASYELLGRMGSVINYKKLDKEVIKEIIQEMVKKESQGIGCEIVLEEAMIDYLVENANSNYGCRLLSEIIHDHAIRMYAQIMKKEIDMSEVRIILKDKDNACFEKVEEEEQEYF